MSSLYSSNAKFALLAVGLFLHVASASAQVQDCSGKNILETYKSSEATVYAAIRKAADATDNAKHVLWKIEQPDKPDRQASYLFGTIHFTDDRVQKLPPLAEAAMISSRRIALEVEDTSQRRLNEALGTMGNAAILSGSDGLDKWLNAAELGRTHKVLARANIAPAAAARLRPWVATVMLATSDCERSRMIGGKLTMDGEIARRAEARGMGAMGLETVELQFKSLAEVPDADQLGVLKANLAGLDRINDLTETIVQLYLKRDLGAIWPLQLELARKAGVDPKVFDKYQEHLLVARNKRMRDRAYLHLQRGGLFVAIGALHLVGPNGMVALLKEMGFTLTAVE
jgi:uncharacterized protein YbaP (TraB family)